MSRKNYPLEYGTILDDRYVVREILGEGGFGITYAGENERIGLKVAIKEFFCREYMGRDISASSDIYLSDDSEQERFQKEKSHFLKEARTLSDFSAESGLVHVNDYFEANGTAYIVMNYLTGTTLKEYVKQNGPMDPDILLRKMKPLMKTLSKIHAAGLLHRDISPDNIMLLEDGALCLIDFGAAISYNVAEKSYSMICKRSYAAPEMYNSKGDLDPKADIYSLSATLYYCLTGKDPEDSLQRILMDELEPAGKSNPAVNPDVERLLDKGLSIQAGKRFRDMEEFLSELEVLYPEQNENDKKRIGKKALALMIAAVMAVAALAAGLLYYLPRRTELRFRNIDTEVVWLYTDEGMSAQDYNMSKEIVKDRLEIFAGKNNYLWEEQGNKIRMEFPVSLLEGHDPASVTRCYLSRTYDLSMIPEEETGSLEQAQAKAVSISREDLAEVVLLTGQIEGIERSRYDLPETGDYRYFHITLTDDAAASLNEKFPDQLNKASADLRLYYDIDMEDATTYYYDNCVSCGDGKSFYLINSDQEGTYLDVLNYTLTHAASKVALGVMAEPLVNWEKPEDSWIAGEYQVDESTINGPYLILQYSFPLVSSETKSSWAHNMIAFKARLDALEIPYAFGLLDYNNSTFALKIREEDASREPFDLLAARVTGLRIGTKWNTIEKYVYSSSVKSDPDRQTLSIAPGLNDISKIEEKAKAALDSGDREAYLFYGDYPIARIPAQDLINIHKDGEIVFRDFLFDNMKLLDFVDVSSRENIVLGGSVDTIYLKDDSDGSFTELAAGALPNVIESICTDREQIMADMKAFAEQKGGSVTFEENHSGVTAKFWFFEVNKETIAKDLCEFAESLVREYQDPFAAGDIDPVTIYLDINEEGSKKHERLGIYISKDTDLGCMCLSAVYNQNLGMDGKAVLKEITDYFKASPVLKDINTENIFTCNN